MSRPCSKAGLETALSAMHPSHSQIPSPSSRCRPPRSPHIQSPNPDANVASLPDSLEWNTASIGDLQCTINVANDKSSPTCPTSGG
jgi:hypothetical protein